MINESCEYQLDVRISHSQARSVPVYSIAVDIQHQHAGAHFARSFVFRSPEWLATPVARSDDDVQSSPGAFECEV